MKDGLGGIPKFPGDLSDHLPPREPVPPDRWSDRIRHAWLWHLILAVLMPMWITALVVMIVNFGKPLGFLSALVVLLPLGIYCRIVMWRALSGRDPNTGERIGPPER